MSGWTDDAECAAGPDRPDAMRQVDLVMFPDKPDDEASYDLGRRMYCAPCPVSEACLAAAMATETSRAQRHGLRGGLSPMQRDALAQEETRLRRRVERREARART